MDPKSPSLQTAIAVLREHRERLEAKLGMETARALLFNLTEIELDLQDVAARLVQAVEVGEEVDRLCEVLSDVQYGSLPHIVGHLKEIEKELDRRRDFGKVVLVTDNKG